MDQELAPARANGARRLQRNPRLLSDVQRRFEVLKGQLGLLDALRDRIRGWDRWTDDLDDHWEQQRGAILEEMSDLAWRAVSVASARISDWQTKAHILLDWCVTDDGDLVHCLAASLCKDVLESRTADSCLSTLAAEKHPDAAAEKDAKR